MHARLACAACGGVPLAILGVRAGKRLCARRGFHLGRSWGEALDEDWSKPPSLVAAAKPPQIS